MATESSGGSFLNPSINTTGKGEEVESDDDEIDEEILQQAFESGLRLREYAKNLGKDARSAGSSAVSECIGKAEEMAKLYGQIDSCDKLLGDLESRLSAYLEDLALINVDMQRLKEQSVVLNQQLHNRQMVSGELSQFVDDMVVSHSMIKTITEGDINEPAFLEQLHELQHKVQFLKAQEFKEAKAVGDVHDVVENLKYKAMERVREWLLLKINSFKKPLTNYQIPQNALLKNRLFYEFLLGNDRQVAKEVRDEYMETLSKVFFSYFKAYTSRLFKLQMRDSASKEDMLGAEDMPVSSRPMASVTGLFTSAKTQSRSKATVFSLGHRDQILENDTLTSSLIVPHVAQQANETFQFEAIFRSVQHALVDHCSHERLFCADFFLVSGESAIELLHQIMGKSLSHLTKTLEEKIETNFDAISLWLCIHVCQRYEQLMAERTVTGIEHYWKTLQQLLWQRLDAVMQMHNDSVRNLDPRRLQIPVDTRPHYVVRRYAEFVTSLLVAGRPTPETPLDPHLQQMLSKQQIEVETLLNRFAAQLRSKKERLIFQINNYDVILSVLDSRMPYQGKERSSFWELQQTKINAYVEEVLAPYFSQLIEFVQECEPLIEQGHTQLLTRYGAKRTQIVRSFGAEWKRSIEAVNKEILQSFTNFKNGTNILQIAFTQFLYYYQRLAKVLSHEAFTGGLPSLDERGGQIPTNDEQLVNYHHITAELKKYKPQF